MEPAYEALLVSARLTRAPRPAVSITQLQAVQHILLEFEESLGKRLRKLKAGLALNAVHCSENSVRCSMFCSMFRTTRTTPRTTRTTPRTTRTTARITRTTLRVVLVVLGVVLVVLGVVLLVLGVVLVVLNIEQNIEH